MGLVAVQESRPLGFKVSKMVIWLKTLETVISTALIRVTTEH